MGQLTISRVRQFADPSAGGATVAVLTPPYREFRPFASVAGFDLPFGAIAVASGQSALALLGALTLTEQRWPWVIPVLVPATWERRLEQALALVSELRHRVVAVRARGGQVDGAAVLEAVRRRPFPPSGELAQYVARRLGDPSLVVPLTLQFAAALEGASPDALSSATFSRLFSRRGALTARDWRSLAVLAKELSARAAGRPADGSLVTARTVDVNVKRFLGCTTRVCVLSLGWEWVLEQALRVGHYQPRSLVSH